MVILTNSVSALLVATQDGHVARISDALSSFPSSVDVSPTSAQRASIGEVIKLVPNPRNSRQAFLYGSGGILSTNNVSADSVLWQPVHSLESGISGIDNGDGTHTQRINFRLTDGGFNIDYQMWEDFGIGDYYVLGEGFVTPARLNRSNLYEHGMFIGRKVDNTTYINSVKSYFNFSAPPNQYGVGNNFGYLWFEKNGVFITSLGYIFGDETLGEQQLTQATNIDFTTNDEFAFRAVDAAQRPTPEEGIIRLHQIDIIYSGDDPPFGISNGTFIADFQPALGRKDTYYWLSKRTESAVEYVYFNATFDNFATVQTRKVDNAKYNASTVYGIAQAPNGQMRTIWVTAGDPTQIDGSVYESRDLGASFTQLVGNDYDLGSGGGAIFMPRQLTGSALTDGDLIVVKGMDAGNYVIKGIASNSAAISTATGILSNQAILACGYNGNLINVGVVTTTGHKLVTSSNGGSTWVDKALPAGSEIHCLNGFGNDSDYLVIGGESTLAYSLDRGTTWEDLWSDFSAWASGWDTKIVTVIPGTPPAPNHSDAPCPFCHNSDQG